MGYSKKYSLLDGNDMDKWNLHCLSNHKIDNNKIKLCYINESYSMIDIFIYAINNTLLNIKDNLPILYEYLKTRNYIN